MCLVYVCVRVCVCVCLRVRSVCVYVCVVCVRVCVCMCVCVVCVCIVGLCDNSKTYISIMHHKIILITIIILINNDRVLGIFWTFIIPKLPCILMCL